MDSLLESNPRSIPARCSLTSAILQWICVTSIYLFANFRLKDVTIWNMPGIVKLKAKKQLELDYDLSGWSFFCGIKLYLSQKNWFPSWIWLSNQIMFKKSHIYWNIILLCHFLPSNPLSKLQYKDLWWQLLCNAMAQGDSADQDLQCYLYFWLVQNFKLCSLIGSDEKFDKSQSDQHEELSSNWCQNCDKNLNKNALNFTQQWHS